MRILFDTNILVRAVKPGTGPAREALLTATSDKHVLISSEFILDEVRRAFSYPRLRSRLPLTDEQIASYVAELARDSVIVDPDQAQFSTPLPCRDPDDEPVIKAAIVGHADVLCTLDRDIRREAVSTWCMQFGIHVLTDIELLHVLRILDDNAT